MQFPRTKNNVKNIKETWSLNLVYIDNLAKKNNCNVKYPLVAIDCFSRCLKVEPVETKYATEAAEAFKKLMKY